MNTERITAAILACDVSPTARELSTPLVDAVLTNLGRWPETKMRVVDVEKPWHLWLDDNTLLVGVIDAIFEDEHGLLLGEWKTKGAPKLTKAGVLYKGDTEDDWLEDISTGPQLAIYALSSPGARILVRAGLKSTPVSFWPTQSEKGIYSFTSEYLAHVRRALLNKAAQIRAARSIGQPFQLTGTHCTNKYRRVCEFKHLCEKGQFAELDRFFDLNNPAYLGAMDAINRTTQWNTKDLVVLSASSYQDASWCLQRHEYLLTDLVPKRDDVALEIGICYHAALAEIYRQIKESQCPTQL